MSRPEPQVAPLPAREHEPLFAEAWEAEVLGLAYSLIEAGRITNAAWSDALGAARAAQAAAAVADKRDSYYLAAIEALERLVQQTGLAEASEMAERKADWVAAYRSTPHGRPVRLTLQGARRS